MTMRYQTLFEAQIISGIYKDAGLPATVRKGEERAGKKYWWLVEITATDDNVESRLIAHIRQLRSGLFHAQCQLSIREHEVSEAQRRTDEAIATAICALAPLLSDADEGQPLNGGVEANKAA